MHQDYHTHRQVAELSANAPPMTGPKIQPPPHTNPVKPMYIGLSRSVVLMARMFSTPKYIPAPPAPAVTLPTIKAFMFGAPPQSAEPTANMIKLAIYKYLTSHMPYAFPRDSIVAIEPSGKPIPSHPSFSTEPKVDTAAAWISATMVWSRP